MNQALADLETQRDSMRGALGGAANRVTNELGWRRWPKKLWLSSEILTGFEKKD
jgi:hypothetical protein